MKATIELISPNGVPVNLEVTEDMDRELTFKLLEKADNVGRYFAGKGWAFAGTPAQAPTASELDKGPTFCGYPCSPTTDDRGIPSWILVDGRQAHRREKQGDTWFSLKTADGTYEQVLRIPKGEKVPAVKGL